MKNECLFFLFWVIVFIPHAGVASESAEQNKFEAKVVGEVSDGRPAPPAAPKKLPSYKIHLGVVQQKKDHKVTINRVAAPEEPVTPPTEQLTASELLQRDQATAQLLSNQKPHGGFFFVMATTYDDHATLVRWSHKGEEFEVWSNVDWNYLNGFSSFEGRGKRYDFLMLHGTAKSADTYQRGAKEYLVNPDVIPELPSLAEKGARYMVMKGDEHNEEAMEFIEAIHDLYSAEHSQLVAAHKERQRNGEIRQARNEALRLNPPPKPDVIINYWKRHTSVKTNRKNG